MGPGEEGSDASRVAGPAGVPLAGPPVPPIVWSPERPTHHHFTVFFSNEKQTNQTQLLFVTFPYLKCMRSVHIELTTGFDFTTTSRPELVR